jgi:hypothetical protein
MTRFFRNIRQKLAAENSVAKYLRYAIGEIILVVIGILIALQINNWNENRKERLIEIKYLKNLKHDLQNDSTDILKFKNTRIGISNAAHELLKYAKLQNFSDVYRLDSLYITVALWVQFIPNNNTFEELRSSGNLQLLKNDSIKNLLLDLNKKYEELVSDRNHMRREYDNYLYDQRVGQISFLDVSNPDEINTILDWYYPHSQIVTRNRIKLQAHFKTLLNNTTFINGLALAAGNNIWIVEDDYNIMQNKINRLIKLIDQDLNN